MAYQYSLVAISGLRLLLAQRFKRLPALQQQRQRWQRWFAVGAIASGCVWGPSGDGGGIKYDPTYSSDA